MLAARDNKHNIVEKLLELGAVVTDRDKASTVISLITGSSANSGRLSRYGFHFLMTQDRHQSICHFGSFFTLTLITRNFQQNIWILARL